MTRRITKIFGPPGTGKTTRLLEIVDQEIASGTPPHKIAFMSFTKKATEEATGRAKLKFGLTDDQLPHFRTIHSMAFRAIGATSDEVMQKKNWLELAKALGFRMSGQEDEYSHLPMGTLLGDKCARIEALSRLRGVDLRSQWEEANEYDCPFQAVSQWVRGLEAYKEARGLLDFTDLLENFQSPIEAECFIIDEAQDLSPLQWSVVSKAAKKAGRIFLAGDDDQAIYGWAGADAARLINIRGDVQVLPKSHRLPEEIYRMASSVTELIRLRQPKNWSAAKPGGEIHRVRYDDNLAFGDGKKWMCLARNRATLRRFETVLVSQGYPYSIEGKSSVNTPAVRALVGWERARRGEAIPVATAREVGSFLGQELALPRRGEVDLSRALINPGTLQLNWMEALKIPPVEREYYRSCLANGESLTKSPRIVVSTIHRSKGGEADNVALIPDLSSRPFNQMSEDHELRVLYVALTRAKESLTIVEPQSIKSYRI